MCSAHAPLASRFDADVAIAGMGPVGMTLAIQLARSGLSVLMLERTCVPYGLPRAVGIDDESMRMLQSIGLDEALEPRLIKNVTAQFLRPDGALIARMAPRGSPFWERSAYSFFYQPDLEQLLSDTLAALPGVQTRRGVELGAFAQDERGVTLDWREVGGTGATGVSRVRYLVGCDGGRSTVRQALGIGMRGRSYPQPWLVVDIKQKEPTLNHLPYFSYYCCPQRPYLNCPQPNGHHRFEFMLLPGETKEQMEDPATVRALMQRFVDPDKVEVIRHLVYTFNALSAERWRMGRVMLAGDSAHMMPQFFGQGLNSGMRDAANLGWKLALVASGRADARLLDSYQPERQPHVEDLIRTSVRIGHFVSLRNPLAVLARNTLSGLAMAVPALRRFISELRFKTRPRFADGSYLGLPRRRGGAEGSLLIQPQVRTIDGTTLPLDACLGTGFALLGWGIDPRASLDAGQLAVWERLGVRCVRVCADGARTQGTAAARGGDAALIELEDISGALQDWLRRHGGRSLARHGAVVIVRPDRYVYALVGPSGVALATAALARQLAPVATATGDAVLATA